MNEVMKTLTVVSVFFMPLTFVVGVYGMNFDNMPELHWKYGYFYVVAGMFLLFVSMIIYFKRKNWF
jgi:magnesium transporter